MRTTVQWQQSPGASGPMVSPCDNGNPCAFLEAEIYCAALGNGFRLPKVEELFSLVDFSVSIQAEALNDGGFFKNVQPAVYWSSARYARLDFFRWVVDFGSGGNVLVEAQGMGGGGFTPRFVSRSLRDGALLTFSASFLSQFL